MKTEDILSILSLIRNRTTEVKSFIDDIQQVSEHLAVIAKNSGEVATLMKSMIEKIEDITRKGK